MIRFLPVFPFELSLRKADGDLGGSALSQLRLRVCLDFSFRLTHFYGSPFAHRQIGARSVFFERVRYCPSFRVIDLWIKGGVVVSFHVYAPSGLCPPAYLRFFYQGSHALWYLVMVASRSSAPFPGVGDLYTSRELFS